MMRKIALIIAMLVGVSLFAGQAFAITFDWSGYAIVNGDNPLFLPSGSAEFVVSGSQLFITLTNTSSQEIRANWQVLSGLTWDIEAAGVNLVPVSAYVYNSHLVDPVLSYTDLSSEWAFRDDLSTDPFGAYGLSSVGNLVGVGTYGPNDRIDPLHNLLPPPSGSPGGVNAGIVGPNFNPNGGFDGPVVQGDGTPATAGAVRFTFNFSGDLAESDFTNVRPVFGSDGYPAVPEPATMSLLGLGLVGLLILRNKKR